VTYLLGNGASTNMSFNEVIANAAAQVSQQEIGQYTFVHPMSILEPSVHCSLEYVSRITSMNQYYSFWSSFGCMGRGGHS
jgi:aspartate ammonia-lyase